MIDFRHANVVAVSPVQLTKIKAHQQSNGQFRSFINSFPLNPNQKITNLTAIKAPVRNGDEQKLLFGSHSLNKSYSFNPISCIKPSSNTNNNSKSNILIVSPKLNSLSTFQLNKPTDDISSQENSILTNTTTSRPAAPLIKPVITATTSANRNNMVISKTIIPSSFGALRYKTLVKIITPETNNPDGNKKIKISSSCLMPAYTCMPNAAQQAAKHVPFMPVIKSNENPNEKSNLPKVVDSPKLLTKLITTTTSGQQNSYTYPPKLVATPQFSSPNPKKVFMASTCSNPVSLSSFVPIRPKQDALGTQGNTYLKSIVCSAAAKSSLAPNEHGSGPQARTNPNLLNSLENLQRVKSSNAITVVQTGTSNSLLKSDEAAAAAEVSESDRLKYIEIRRRKRKQDLSSLKNQALNCAHTNQQELQSSTARSLNFKNFITNQFAAAAATAKPADNANRQQGDQHDELAAYSFKRTHPPVRPNLLSKSSASSALPKLHRTNQLALFRKSIGKKLYDNKYFHLILLKIAN